MQYSIIPASEIPMQNLSFWQANIWWDILSESWQVRDIFYYGNLQGTFLLIEVRSIGLGHFGAFSLGVISSQIGDDLEKYLKNLQEFLNKKWILFFQIEPIDSIVALQWNSQAKISKKFLTPYTRIINLSQSEEEILSGMHEKWRYNIRLATKRGVQIEKVILTSETLDLWMWLLDATLSRDGFSGNSRKYYESFISNLEKGNSGWLYFARFENRIIAAWIFVFTPSRAIYYYGASSSLPEDRKQMSPYLLQWHAICEGRSRNIPFYDFLGIADPENPYDSLRGVTDFKEKFGWSIVELPQKILFPLSWKYPYYLLFQKIKNLLKRR